MRPPTPQRGHGGESSSSTPSSAGAAEAAEAAGHLTARGGWSSTDGDGADGGGPHGDGTDGGRFELDGDDDLGFPVGDGFGGGSGARRESGLPKGGGGVTLDWDM